MTDIDHKAEAIAMQNLLAARNMSGGADVIASFANMHATLALRDELRLANLIAYLPRTKESGQEDSQRAVVRALVEERLGL